MKRDRRLAVESAGRLVHKKKPRPQQKDACQDEPLLLTARKKLIPALIVPPLLGEVADETGEAGRV